MKNDIVPVTQIASQDDKIQYERVLSLALDIGKGLLSCGSSVSRVENAVERICLSYGSASVNVWVVPSMIVVSIVTPHGQSLTLMERVYSISNNLLKMEHYNQLSRDICYKKLPIDSAERGLKALKEKKLYPTGVTVIAGAIAAGAFSVLYDGTPLDAVLTVLVAALMVFLNAVLSVKSFNSYARSFILSLIGGVGCILLTATADAIGIECHLSNVMIGTIMVVAPGLLVCNAVRDLFIGDLFSGTFQILNGILTMLAIVAGYASAMLILRDITVINPVVLREGIEYYLYAIFAGMIGVAGFSLMFSIGKNRILPATANAIATFIVYILIKEFNGDLFIANLCSTAFGAVTSEILARATKAPSTIYIIPSILITVPGGALYYTLNYLVQGDMVMCASKGVETLIIFLGMAVGLSIVTAIFQIVNPIKYKKRYTKKFFDNGDTPQE